MSTSQELRDMTVNQLYEDLGRMIKTYHVKHKLSEDEINGVLVNATKSFKEIVSDDYYHDIK